ncbi:ORF6N domain-containing protein [uncultured Dechloromonas sp.]|uniref:ORF6N domain-containing protein n=1 Tax=uncultured Dechloromonas sp. TaxID=171719 RepID=UPI0025CC9A0B|nr:ORF6N domain-containing protein [uncultured Dechloromonas sp.]
MSVSQTSIPVQSLIGSRILVLREQRVMLDSDLAELYGVETRVLVQAVKRNQDRFPDDFMFQLNNQDVAALRSQAVISKPGRGGRRTAPYAFTEQGVAMLSSVLSSPRAIAINIEIMRTFVRVRELANTHGDLAKRLGELEEKNRNAGAATRQFRAQHPCSTEAGFRGNSRIDDATGCAEAADWVCETGSQGLRQLVVQRPGYSLMDIR